jgi:lipoprotein-releasing system permease protein
MFNPVSIFIGVRYTLARRLSRSVSFISAIAIIGLILGISLLILVLSVMNGFDKELRERTLNIIPQVSLYHTHGVSNWQQLRRQLLNTPNVIGIAPFVQLQGMITAHKAVEPALIYGVSGDYEADVSIINHYLKKGTLGALSQQQHTAVLGSGLASKLKLDIGDKFTLIIPQKSNPKGAPSIVSLRVLDIFSSQTELDQSLVLMGLQSAAALTENDQAITGLRFKVDDLFAASATARQLIGQLPNGFYSSDWTRTHGNIYHAVQLSKKIVSLLLLLIIAIAAFNVVSTLVMVVVDKHSDIAILRTLGASSRDIMAIFIVQGTVIGIIGTLLGGILGIALSLVVQDVVKWVEDIFGIHFLESDVYPISFLPSEIIWHDVFLVLMISILMSLLATIYPSLKASHIRPAEALRYE